MKKNNIDDFDFSLEEELPRVNFGGNSTHPDALTPDEILKSDKETVSNNSALDALLKRMTTHEEEKKNQEKPVPQPKTEAELKIPSPVSTELEPKAQSPVTEVKKTEIKPQKSLLDKCMPYILDEDGKDTTANQKPLYELQSVAEILKEDSQKTLEKLSREYGVVFDDIQSPPVKPLTVAPIAEENKVSEETAPTEAKEPEKKAEAKEKLPVISDIDIPDSPFYKPNDPVPSAEETVTFTPITEPGDLTSKILVSTNTKPLNFTGELLKVTETAAPASEEVQLEKSEFDEYTPKEEYTDTQSGRGLLKKFAKQKKNAFLSMWGSILLTLVAAFFLLPFMSNVILTNTRVCMIIVTATAFTATLLNIKSFRGIVRIFTSKSGSDVPLFLAMLFTLAYSVVGIIKNEIILNSLVTLLVILAFNAIKEFVKISALLRSFKQVYNPSPKQAITLLSDPAITQAMTKGAVEGDCLIAAPQSTAMVDDFMKHYTYGTFLNGRMNIVTVISLVLAVLSGFLATTLFDGIFYGFYAASAVMIMSALPSLFFIDRLPFYHSAKKLALKGAMIAGKTGAELVEQANAVVLTSKDLFPAGTVTLHQMQVLSENNLDDTILRAASLTEALQSPLAPIFKKIAGTSNITVFPDSDTVKYEEALGISGWVDNRLLFIGNRTLMEAHGISVPDVELDRKILRQGYFPVYVSDQNKACALLVVKYDIDTRISTELRRLTSSGVTLLIKTSDPNLTEEMICDYFGLYEDSVKVMTAAGCHIYVNSVTPAKSLSAAASFRTNPAALPAILNCANKIKRSNALLTATYVISAVFGVLLFAYTSFGGSGSLLSDTVLLLYSLITTALSYLLYLTQKP